MKEWFELASVLQKLNPDKYEIMLFALRELVEAEAELAGVDFGRLIAAFRQPISA